MSKPIDTRTVLLAPGVAMTFCWIPPGRFRMGSRDGRSSEHPVHEVEITQGFWLGQTPVTQRQYAAFAPEHENHFRGNPDHPAESTDWNRAVAFCEWLTKQLNANEWKGWVAGLPSEAQWEYACRAGTQTDYHTGDGVAALHRAGWFEGNAKSATHPVGQRNANGFGLYDMHGNVVEWCRDAWDKHAYCRRAERAPEAGQMDGAAADPARAVRGGAWGTVAGSCRAAYRDWNLPGWLHIQGFRVALFPGLSCPDKIGGSARAAGRRAGSARARGGAGATMDHDARDTMNEIALSSLDGKHWHDAEGKPIKSARIHGRVIRVVIGTLDAKKAPITITDALWQQVRTHWPSITHLHLWSIKGLAELPELPAKLECLDIRHSPQLALLPALPDTLETLDLAGCTALKQLPAGDTPALRCLHLDGCTGLRAWAINAKIGACPTLEELTLAGCTQVDMLDGLGEGDADGNFPLRKLVLRGCARLARLPHLRGLGKLQHLNLSGCKVLLALPSIPDSLQYLILSGCDRLVEFDGQGIDVRDRGWSGEDNVAPWFQVRRRYGEALAFSARAKLLLLGDGRAGKTTLAKRLVWNSLAPAEQGKPDGQAMQPIAGELFTHQIRFFQWRCPVDVPEEVASRAELITDKGRLHAADEHHGRQVTARVGIWDFGGQEIYHRTHRLFTSAGNVFLIVWRAALDEVEIRASCPGDMAQDEWLELNRQRPLDYWLQYVRSVNPQARLALVCTHRAGGDSMPDWSNRLVDRSLRAPDVRRFFVDSLEDDADKAGELSDLYAWLRVKLTEQVEENGLIVPLFFAQVGERIEAMLAENDAARREQRPAEHLLLDWPRWCDEVRRVHASLALSVALQEADIRELTMHLHRTGALFLLDPSAGGWIEHAQVVIDQSWACGIMYEVLRPGGALRARIKRNGGWFEELHLDLSPVWKALDPGRRQIMIGVMQQCDLIVEIAHWAQGPEMPRMVYLANEKWLLPAFSDVQNRLDAAMATIRGDVKSQRLVLKQPSIDEFRAHRLMAELCRKFGRNAIWFQTGLQSIEDRSVPTWCLRVRWSASDERVGYLGTVDAQVFACAEVLAEVLTEFHKLFADIGFPIDAPTLESAEVPSRLHEAGNYFRLSLRGVADVGISARGANAEPVERFVGVLREAGVEDVKWYREDEHQAQIRASGVSHYMEQVLGKSLVQVLFFSDQYLEDGGDNLHCPWELANAIKEWKANRLSRDRVVVVWLPRAECGLDEVATRIKLVFKSLSSRFLDLYRASDSESDLDDHRHFKEALAHVDEFLGARGSWRGHFYTLDDLGSATTGSAVVKQVLALLQQ